MNLESFSTPRLLAERLTAAHLPDLRRMDLSEPFMANLGGVRDEAGTVSYLQRNLAHWEEHGFGLWMLRDRMTQAIIGRASLRYVEIESVDEVQTGYGFLPDYWGRGLATEVARACVHLGRNRLGLASVVAITLRANTASQHVLLKAGMVYEREITHEGLHNLLFRTRDAIASERA